MNNNCYELDFICPICKKITRIILTYDQYLSYLDYKNGFKKIQEVFPELPPSIREIMQTGICIKCQDLVFVN